MNRSMLDKIAEAVLYEGYMLYPYRPSVKNSQRWTFGGLYPESFCSEQADRSSNQAECLLQGDNDTALDVTIRFLHLTDRTVGALQSPATDQRVGQEAAYIEVPSLSVGDREFRPWQEAEERTVCVLNLQLDALCQERKIEAFAFPARRWVEPLTSPDGTNVGVVVRQQQHVEGALEIDGQSIGESLFKLTVRARNTTQFEGGGRDDALCRALVSAHTILEVRSGSFVSLLDPPAQSKEAAAACANIGLFPVLVGAAGATDTLLASPIILYDYPQVAPESPTNLFDGCEIDEILTLRIMTLTDEEKQDAAAVDERTKNLLATTEALAREQLSQLHGAFRAVDGGK